MAYNITEIVTFDNKRNKVTLDYGEVTFLLYKGECKKLDLAPNGQKTELSEEEYRQIMDEILTPRARKKILYYLKNEDKTRAQIRKKLKEGFYPNEVIDSTFAFLDRYSFADDARYAENYIEELKGRKSKREIEAKLAAKGIRGETVRELLGELEEEDEYAAAVRCLGKKYSAGVPKEERQKAFAFLARKGFSYDAVEHAIAAVSNQDNSND